MKLFKLSALCFVAISCSTKPAPKVIQDESVVLVFVDPVSGEQTEKRFRTKQEAQVFLESYLTSQNN